MPDHIITNTPSVSPIATGLNTNAFSAASTSLSTGSQILTSSSISSVPPHTNISGGSANLNNGAAPTNISSVNSTSSIGVAPTSSTNGAELPPTLKKSIEVFSGLNVVLGLGVAAVGAVTAWKKWWGPKSTARELGSDKIDDWGVPKVGSYKCQGNPGSDAAINALIAEAKSNVANPKSKDTPDILIEGSKDVGKYWIGKGIAAELKWNALRINCSELAITGVIPEHFVNVLEKRILKSIEVSGKPGVVLILDNIDGFACARQEKFTRKLASRLLSNDSPLKKYAVVVGTLDTEAIPSCGKDPLDQELLDVLRSALTRKLEVYPPQNANEISRLIRFKLEDRIRHATGDSSYNLPESENETLLLLAKALPELRNDSVARELAINVSESLLQTKAPLRQILITRALDQILGVAAQHASDPNSEEVDAVQVACEGVVAKALGLGVLALGVQSRVKDAYVLRERPANGSDFQSLKGENIHMAYSEIVTAWARYLGTQPPYNTCKESVAVGESDIQERTAPIAQALAESLLVERGTVVTSMVISSLTEKIDRNARAAAKSMLHLLSSHENDGKIAGLVNNLLKRTSGDGNVPTTSNGHELCCLELDSALAHFDFTAAKARFDEFMKRPDLLVLE